MTRIELAAYHLQHYAEGRQEIIRIRETLEHFGAESISETIEELTFPGGEITTRVQAGRVADPTAEIASIFRDVHRANTDATYRELIAVSAELTRALDSIQTCVDALEGRQRRIIVGLYFQKQSWEQVSEAEHISRSTMQYHRNKALEEISKMPLYLAICFAQRNENLNAGA